jgi:ArsR family transcriptional regulator
MRNLAQLFKAFSDDTRLKMLVLLSRHGELCVCDFEGALGLSQSAASRHLRHLFHAGLVDDTRRGTWVYYRLRAEGLADRQALLGALLQAAPEAEVARLDEALADWRRNRSSDTTCTR